MKNPSENKSDMIDTASPTETLSIEEKSLINKKKPNHFITLFPMKQDSSSNTLHGSFSTQDRPSIVSSMDTDTISSVEPDYEFLTSEEDVMSDQSSTDQPSTSQPSTSQPTVSVGKNFIGCHSNIISAGTGLISKIAINFTSCVCFILH